MKETSHENQYISLLFIAEFYLEGELISVIVSLYFY